MEYYILLLLISIFKTVEYVFSWILWIERSKDQHLFEIKSFCNIIHYTIQKLGVSIIFFVGGIIEFNTFI